VINRSVSNIAALAFLVGVFGLPLVAGAETETVRDLDVYYEREDVDLADYNAILIDSLGLDDARIVRPPWYDGEEKNPKKWRLTDSDIKWLRKSYRETMTAAITDNDGYKVVTEPGEGVLVLDIEIIYLMPYAERGEKVTTRGFGEMLVQAQLRDGMTGQLLAVYEGKQDVGSAYQENSRLNNETRLRALFEYWGSRVRGIMDASR